MKRIVISLAFYFAVAMLIAQNPVKENGALSVKGNMIVNGEGKQVSFAGNSFFWSNTGWGGEKFYNESVIKWLHKDWNSTIIRAAMGVEKQGGYFQDPSNKQRVETVVNAAIEEGIYVIIDWHSHHAENFVKEAVEFFVDMAKKYGEYDNVIYEIYNEPLDVSWTKDIKPYAETVIAAIRNVDPDNLIVVGTPQWSQDVDSAAANPIKGYKNIVYTLHFYAGSHKDILINKAKQALNAGIPLMVTEWGTVNANGDGEVDTESVDKWMTFLCEKKLTHCNWSVTDKKEGASILNPGANPYGNWKNNDLTESGKLVKTIIISWDGNCN
jgi:aryl-phospho-beta-D-glucosidase BglC (GH1 family)